ncbi:MAG: IMPACT family protein [Saprospiraceae bacterium]|nr:IMPACT family protein [Saprospiraceae bacterium]
MSLYSYNTIAAPSTDRYTVKASKFYGYAFPVDSEAAIKEALVEVNELHPKARHHCYAWRLGLDKNLYRVNDAGEPSGSAGRPILNQIDSAQLTNILVVVVRYFGGTKLGIPGLIKAYKLTTNLSLDAAEIVTKIIQSSIELKLPYDKVNVFHQQANKLPITLLSERFSSTHAYFEISFPKSDEALVQSRFKEWI